VPPLFILICVFFLGVGVTVLAIAWCIGSVIKAKRGILLVGEQLEKYSVVFGMLTEKPFNVKILYKGASTEIVDVYTEVKDYLKDWR